MVKTFLACAGAKYGFDHSKKNTFAVGSPVSVAVGVVSRVC